MTDAQRQRYALARSVAIRVMKLAEVGGDAVQVLDGFLMRLELGADRYGELDLRREHRDWHREADDEISDFAVYKALSRTSLRQQQADAISAGLAELRNAGTNRSLKDRMIELDEGEG